MSEKLLENPLNQIPLLFSKLRKHQENQKLYPKFMKVKIVSLTLF